MYNLSFTANEPLHWDTHVVWWTHWAGSAQGAACTVPLQSSSFPTASYLPHFPSRQLVVQPQDATTKNIQSRQQVWVMTAGFATLRLELHHPERMEVANSGFYFSRKYPQVPPHTAALVPSTATSCPLPSPVED